MGGDEGAAAAAWFSQHLGRPVMLVRWLGNGGLPPSATYPARRVPMCIAVQRRARLMAAAATACGVVVKASRVKSPLMQWSGLTVKGLEAGVLGSGLSESDSWR